MNVPYVGDEKIDMIKTCCCTGHRPKGFPWHYHLNTEKTESYRKELTIKIEKAIANGFSHFLTGMALGADMDFAECVLSLRDKKRLPITLEAVIPCADQTKCWNEKDIFRYEQILQHIDSSIILSKTYTNDCMLARNRNMVDRSDLVIAVFNGIQRGGTWYTIRYAQSQNVPLDYLLLKKDY